MIYFDPKTRKTYDDSSGELVEVSNQQLAAMKTAQETGALESTLVGAGETFTDIGRGAENLVDSSAVPRNRALAAEEAAARGALHEESPWAAGIGQALPYLATAPLAGTGTGLLAGQGVLGTALPTGFAGAAAADAALGGLAGYAGGDPKQAAMQAALAGTFSAVPGVAAAGVRGVRTTMADRVANRIRQEAAGIGENVTAQAAARQAKAQAAKTIEAKQADFFDSVDTGAELPPVSERLNFDEGAPPQSLGAAGAQGRGIQSADYHAELVNSAESYGWQLTPAQKAGDEVGELSEGFMKNLPGVSGYIDEMGNQNQKMLAKEFANALGVQADELNPATLEKARAKINEEFAKVKQALPDITLDSKFWTALDDIEKEAGIDFTDTAFAQKALPRIRETKGQPMTGAQIMRVRQQANKKYASAMNTGDTDAIYWKEIINELDEQIGRSGGPEVADQYAKVRNQWRLLDAVETRGVLDPKAKFNYPTLYNAMRRNFPREMTYDTGGRLFQLTNVARRFGPGGRSSMTAERNMLARALDVGGAMTKRLRDRAKEGVETARAARSANEAGQ